LNKMWGRACREGQGRRGTGEGSFIMLCSIDGETRKVNQVREKRGFASRKDRDQDKVLKSRKSSRGTPGGAVKIGDPAWDYEARSRKTREKKLQISGKVWG